MIKIKQVGFERIFLRKSSKPCPYVSLAKPWKTREVRRAELRVSLDYILSGLTTNVMNNAVDNHNHILHLGY